jgi:predicted transcriptional regulator
LSDSEIKEEIDEDTYSTIFTALKHPIRRRILRMLSEKPLSFTEILNALSINSAQLSFHIKNLRELTMQTENEKYALSAFWRTEFFQNLKEKGKD